MSGWRTWLGALAALVAWLAPGKAEAQQNHSGFTGDLGFGVALTFRPAEPCPSTDCLVHSDEPLTGKLGAAVLPFSLGGWVTPRLALLGRATSTWYVRGEEMRIHSFYGATAEWWPTDVFFVSGGAGLGVFGAWPILARGEDLVTGVAFDFRVGAALTHRDPAFTLSLEATPGFYGGRSVTGTALVAALKWY